MFSMNIDISDDELAAMQSITEPAYSTLALANDYSSWQKEYDEFLKDDQCHDMANAVWILTKERPVSVEDAKNICRDLVRASCQDFRQKKSQYLSKNASKLSHDILTFLGALETAISGNIFWSQSTARYGFVQPSGKDLVDHFPDTISSSLGEQEAHVHKETSTPNTER